MPATPEITADVLRAYHANPRRFSPFKTANALGISIKDVLAIVHDNKDTVADAREHSDGLGRPDLQEFIVAKRRANEAAWDNYDPAIIKARADYEAGTHDLATHRDGAWLFLCSFPLRWHRAPKPDYFIPGNI